MVSSSAKTGQWRADSLTHRKELGGCSPSPKAPRWGLGLTSSSGLTSVALSPVSASKIVSQPQPCLWMPTAQHRRPSRCLAPPHQPALHSEVAGPCSALSARHLSLPPKALGPGPPNPSCLNRPLTALSAATRRADGFSHTKPSFFPPCPCLHGSISTWPASSSLQTQLPGHGGTRSTPTLVLPRTLHVFLSKHMPHTASQ